MKFVDVPDSKRIERDPDNRNVVFSDGKITQDDVEIKKIELLEYKINKDQNLGTYSIITALVDTDQGLIEILYDEGYRGDDALNDSANMLIQNLGLSGLILRSLISLKNKLGKIEE
ncbi:hypothetical protein A7X95_01875 [Candidatus Nitrosopelagicus brevis]|uniref:Uncharacterized protein n=1 Tax=Candidatus Nitrosopelagicus brevis TaxID=1410606 RepID=A0A0A7V1I2_9ARCH|nr:hypothetical protein [Candidatus Nitrosopelagicus brevis]AJA92718.1 hypothetical protein T478_0802 [Candidatus Nitrosopelagicus brevis]PTL88044.1 hypothetical protein A7X95_01875 [Candidatus Nitrosopelagicus brevis]|tara:strand:- start:49 stop:396 length:348 start_codon:yes stop_codon:yes gene_type:complete